MIRTRIEEDNIRVSCSKRQVINVEQVKRSFRTCLRFAEQHGNAPVIVDFDKGARLSNEAQQIFDRWNRISRPITLVVIKS